MFKYLPLNLPFSFCSSQALGLRAPIVLPARGTTQIQPLSERKRSRAHGEEAVVCVCVCVCVCVICCLLYTSTHALMLMKTSFKIVE